MKYYILIVLFLFSLMVEAATNRSRFRNKDRLNPGDTIEVVTNKNGTITRKINRFKGVYIPEAKPGQTLTIVTNSSGAVINAYVRSSGSIVRKSKDDSKLLKANNDPVTTNYVAYVKPINYFKYKPENIVKYVDTTNSNDQVLLESKKAKLLRADGSGESEELSPIEKMIARLEANIASNKVLLAEAKDKGDEAEVERLTTLITKLEKRLDRLYHRYSGMQDGGWYLMSDDTYVTYRTAVNYGFGGEPTNDVMRACYNSITNDPYSLWSVRKRGIEDPTHDARMQTSENPGNVNRRFRRGR